jgi:hypothetical protein
MSDATLEAEFSDLLLQFKDLSVRDKPFTYDEDVVCRLLGVIDGEMGKLVITRQLEAIMHDADEQIKTIETQKRNGVASDGAFQLPSNVSALLHVCRDVRNTMHSVLLTSFDPALVVQGTTELKAWFRTQMQGSPMPLVRAYIKRTTKQLDQCHHIATLRWV